MDSVQVPYKEGYSFGIGVKRIIADARSLSVQGDINPVPGATGGSQGWLVTEIHSTEELEHTLEIHADATGGVGLFSVSPRFDFVKYAKYTDTAIMFVIYHTRQEGYRQIDKPSLTDEAAKVFTEMKTDLFDARYGDSFVRGISSGGQFFAYLKIETRTSYDKEDIKTKLGGAVGSFVKFNSSVDLLDIVNSTGSRLEVRGFCEGGKVNIDPRTPDELIKAMQQWLDSVDNAPRPYQVTLAPYVIAEGPPIDEAVFQHQRDVLTRCAKLRSQAMDALNLVEYMISPDHVGEFIPNPQGPALDLPVLHAALSRDLDLIAEAAFYAIQKPTEAKYVEDYTREVKHIDGYVLTQLPPNMPLHEGLVRVPNFVGLEYLIKFLRNDPPPPGVDLGPAVYEWGTGKTLMDKFANEKGLQFQIGLDFATNEAPSHIVKQDPPAGEYVRTGSTVALTATRNLKAYAAAVGF